MLEALNLVSKWTEEERLTGHRPLRRHLNKMGPYQGELSCRHGDNPTHTKRMQGTGPQETKTIRETRGYTRRI